MRTCDGCTYAVRDFLGVPVCLLNDRPNGNYAEKGQAPDWCPEKEDEHERDGSVR